MPWSMSLMVGRALGGYRTECCKSDLLLSSTENFLKYHLYYKGAKPVLSKIIAVKRVLVINNLSYYGKNLHSCLFYCQAGQNY